MNRPLCKCHSEPMARNGLHPSGKQKWQCGVGNRARVARWYDDLPWFERNRRQLQNRRYYGLKRMAARG